jgi:hypothetical protein
VTQTSISKNIPSGRIGFRACSIDRQPTKAKLAHQQLLFYCKNAFASILQLLLRRYTCKKTEFEH